MACTPAPTIGDPRCILDANGTEWTCIDIISAVNGTVTTYFNAETNTPGTPEGEESTWTSCEDLGYGFCNSSPTASAELTLTPGGSDNGGVCSDEWLKSLIAKGGKKEQASIKVIKQIRKKG